MLDCIIVDWDGRVLHDKDARHLVYVPKSLVPLVRAHVPGFEVEPSE